MVQNRERAAARCDPVDLRLNGDHQVLGSVSGEVKPHQGGFTSGAHQNANGGIQRGGRHDAVPVQCDAGGLPPWPPLWIPHWICQNQ